MVRQIAVGGVVRCDKVQWVWFSGGTSPEYLRYSGICIDPGQVGRTWQRYDPELIGTLDDWVRLRSEELRNDACETMFNQPVTPEES